MVYWADVMYSEPEASDGAYESSEAGVGTRDFDDDDLPTDDQAFIATNTKNPTIPQPVPRGD